MQFCQGFVFLQCTLDFLFQFLLCRKLHGFETTNLKPPVPKRLYEPHQYTLALEAELHPNPYDSSDSQRAVYFGSRSCGI
jgi:hypothetical protein